MLDLDGYTRAARLGSTTKSEVYAAVRDVDGARVVLKRYLDRAIGTSRDRAQIEHELLQRVQGPGIVRTIAVEHNAEGCVLILERAPGVPMSQLLEQRGPIEAGPFLQVALQITAALRTVHEARILHRDIKPANLMVVPETLEVCLIDFGLAAPYGAAQSGAYGTVVTGLEGSLQYMSPEQTGRMDRGVDFRSDLYSLGATFYDLLTGQPPFGSTDPLALIHAHMARRPPPACEVRPQVPKALSDLVQKLLDKDPEQRYQTTAGVHAHLSHCREQLERTGEITELSLAGGEAPERPLFARRLYGRDAEIRLLHESYAACASGSPQLVVLDGAPGVGKSSMIATVRERVAEAHGYVAQGKFDLYDRERPFQAFIAAFESLVGQWLTESSELLARHQRELAEELGTLAGVMVDLVPDLEFVLRDAEPVPALGPRESQARLSLAVQRFARGCAKRTQPLVLVFDDLQWMDAGSRMLLEGLLVDGKCEALMVLATCRDDEVSAAHPLHATLARLVDCGVAVKRIPLAPLTTADTTTLLAAALLRSPEDTRWLAERAARKTGNVPLLVEHFIDLLWKQGLLRYRHPTGWTWEEVAIEAAEIPDSAVGLMTAKIQQLDARLRGFLGLASCVGDVFDLESLKQLSEQDGIEPALMELSDTGLIAPCREGFRFAHDRVREAAQASLTEVERARLHAEMGLLLFDRTVEPQRSEQAARIVDHLNRGGESLPENLRLPTIDLNLKAYRNWLTAGAPVTAAQYAQAARGWFRETDWGSIPEVGFRVFLACAEGAIEMGDLPTARDTLAVLDTLELDRMEAARVAVQKIRLHAVTAPTQETRDLTLALARRFGVRWPQHPSWLRVWLTILRTDWTLRELGENCFRPATLANPEWIAPILVLSAGVVALSGGSVRLVLLLAALNLRLMRKHGYVNAPSFTLIGYAGQRLGFLQRVSGAQRYLKEAMEWDARVTDPLYSSRAQICSLMYIHAWFKPRRSLLDALRTQAERALELGDVVYAGIGLHLRCSYAGLSGARPADVQALYEHYRQTLTRTAPRGTALALADRAYVILAAESVSEAQLAEELAAAVKIIEGDRGWAPYFAIHWMAALCLLGRFDKALEISEKASSVVLQSNAMMSHVVDYAFYRGLAAAAHRGPSLRARWRLGATLRSACRRVRRDAIHSPDFVHMRDLLEAERARRRGKMDRAMALYEQAATRAARQGYLQHAGLAHERRSTLLLEQRREQAASTAHSRALDAYRQWGSPVVVARLAANDPSDALFTTPSRAPRSWIR